MRCLAVFALRFLPRFYFRLVFGGYFLYGFFFLLGRIWFCAFGFVGYFLYGFFGLWV
jgi:hypothetical protein